MDAPQNTPPPAPAPSSPPSPASGGPPPPAATAVVQGTHRPEDAGELARITRELEEERKARKVDQMRLSELEDERRRLLTPTPPAPTPTADDLWENLRG